MAASLAVPPFFDGDLRGKRLHGRCHAVLRDDWSTRGEGGTDIAIAVALRDGGCRNSGADDEGCCDQC